MTKRIEFLIKPDGTVIERVHDGLGNGCVADTALVEAALGEVVSRELLPEYHETLDNSAVSNTNFETDY